MSSTISSHAARPNRTLFRWRSPGCEAALARANRDRSTGDESHRLEGYEQALIRAAYRSRRETMPTLYLICGLPGSGKSTLARQLEERHPSLHLAPDEWMARIVGNGYDEEKRAIIETIQLETAEQALRLGVDVILENGFWTRKERDEYRARAKALGAQTKLYFLDVPRDELLRRLKQRSERLPPDTFHVKESDLDRWISQFEAPTADELGT
ncbi:MAG TPA: ATP-binding protein [Thermoanaerobaculia bacterium]|nr:ATP-binding protein [Thermoanaerobaculia bacterium]